MHLCTVCYGLARMIELYRSGKLKLEEPRTRTYALDEINAGYDDMRNGRVLRGVITFEESAKPTGMPL